MRKKNLLDSWRFKLTLRKIPMMKNLTSFSLLAGLSIVLWGCPYKSTVPLSTPSEYINKQVLGKWIPKTEESKANPEYYTIEMKDTFHYAVDHFQFNENDSTYEIKSYICWTSNLENILFMNVQQENQKEVMIHRLDVMGDKLMVLYQVTNNIDERFTDSGKMQSFFKKHMKLSFFYNTDEVELIKVEK